MRIRCLIGLAVLLMACGMAGSLYAAETYQIYAPATPTSIPLLLVAQQNPLFQVTIFADHTQAHTLFLRGDIPILTTGLSVGVNFFKQQVPVQIVNSYVSGLSTLVTRGKAVTTFRELQGAEIVLPFEGSPLEEVTRFLATQEGLTWGVDLKPIYAAFPSTLALIKQGQVAAAVLPEPFATMAAAQPEMFAAINYKAAWDALQHTQDGYPQVGTFVTRDWAAAHPEALATLHRELARALQRLQTDPADAVARTVADFQFPEPALQASLQHIDFALTVGAELKQALQAYYQTIGTPFDETFDAFFYFPPQ